MGGIKIGVGAPNCRWLKREEFRPEIKTLPLSVGQYKVFDQCEVRVDEIRTVVEVNPQLTQNFVD